MPTSLTFTNLQAQIVAYLEKGGANDTTVSSYLPNIINQAERRIARELKVLGFINSVQSNLTVGANGWILPKPSDWRQTVSINVEYGTGSTGGSNVLWNPLLPRSLEYVRAYNRDVTVTGPPKYYADYNWSNWAITPNPDQAYPFEVVYYQLPPLLDATNQTNWTSTYAPNLLLYSCLMECEPFIKEDERIAVWKDLYQRELAAMNGEDQAKILDRQVTRQDD